MELIETRTLLRLNETFNNYISEKTKLFRTFLNKETIERNSTSMVVKQRSSKTYSCYFPRLTKHYEL